MNSFPERLETLRLVLTRPADADLPDLVALHTDPRVMATLGGLRGVLGVGDQMRFHRAPPYRATSCATVSMCPVCGNRSIRVRLSRM